MVKSRSFGQWQCVPALALAHLVARDCRVLDVAMVHGSGLLLVMVHLNRSGAGAREEPAALEVLTVALVWALLHLAVSRFGRMALLGSVSILVRGAERARPGLRAACT